MFNLILALAAGIIIGWNFNTFFQALDAPHIIKTDINLSQNIITHPIQAPLKKSDINKTEIKKTEIKKLIPKKQLPKEDSFYTLLHKNLFSDALSLYTNAKEKNILFYRATIEDYFQEKIKENLNESIIQIIEYLEIEPDNRSVKLLLSSAYKDSQEYTKSITIISELLDTDSGDETEDLNMNLIITTQQYIALLKKENNIQEITSFLKEQIDYGLNIPFFSITLAKEYIALKQYAPAIKLLKEIEFDEQYGEEAKILLDTLQSGEIEKEEYTHKLPLSKAGTHFTVEVMVENTPLTLLLDTGASLTMINEDKITSLALLNDNLILKTAGGDITAQLHVAKSFKIGELELKNFKITTSSFKQEKADGLLGMNFFKQFKFKIDQEEEMLYLSRK